MPARRRYSEPEPDRVRLPDNPASLNRRAVDCAPRQARDGHGPATPKRATIVHPTDFSPGDAAAFAHALAMTLASKSQLCLLQVRVADEAFFSPTQGLRHVRDLLVRWGKLAGTPPTIAGSRNSTCKCRASASQPVTPAPASSNIWRTGRANLVVLATYTNKALARWLDVSVHHRLCATADDEPVPARRRARGFVDPKTGALA